VNKRFSAFYFSLLLVASVAYISSCKRIHDSTELGADLIPAVDGITTFDTTISVQTYNDTFWLANADPNMNDSTRLGKGAIHYLGRISNDPLFGATTASIFMELKPPFYKFYFEPKDSITVDSAVLVMGYVETFGDTNALQTINVYEIDNTPANEFKTDSAYLIRKNHLTYSTLLGSKTFAPSILNDSIKVFKDTTKNQLRIRLNQGPGVEYIANKFLKQYDSSAVYSTDSAFRANFKGFAVVPSSNGNAIMGFALPSGLTKLALYYKFKRNNVNVDTVRYFNFNIANGAIPSSANANLVIRNYNGSPANFAFAGGTSVQDDLVYLQNTPGSFAKIKIPDLAGVSNRVVHRAELIVDQVYHPSDDIFYRPEYLFLDVYDTSIKKYRYMPYDFLFDASNAPNLTSFGTTGKIVDDGLGNRVMEWRFNISRYVQNFLTGREANHDMRLFTPYTVNDIYKFSTSVVGFENPFGLNTAIARGRVRVAGGSYTDVNKRMRIRIVYSKI
jgi:hypothetical protein